MVISCGGELPTWFFAMMDTEASENVIEVLNVRLTATSVLRLSQGQSNIFSVYVTPPTDSSAGGAYRKKHLSAIGTPVHTSPTNKEQFCLLYLHPT